MMRRLLFAIVLLGLGASRAGPFVRYLTADGKPLHWNDPTITIGVATDPRSPLTLPEVLDAVDLAIAAWMSIDCDPPAVDAVTDTGAALDPEDRKPSIVWINDPAVWAERFSVTELARTIIIHKVVSGEIVDADIAVNLGGFEFSAGPICLAERFDLQGTVTHELGHLFGLDHSNVREATMNARTDPGDCELRTLSADDVAGFCATYDRPDVAEPEVVELEPAPEAAAEGELGTAERTEAAAERGDGDDDDGCAGGGLGRDGAAGLGVLLGLALRYARRASGRCRRGRSPSPARS